MNTPPTGVTVGLIANPASGHDVRRLISGASIATNMEKVNVVRRLLAGLGATGVDRVLVMPDASGLSVGIERAVEHHRVDRDGVWPTVELLQMEVHQTATDSRTAAGVMSNGGARAIVVIGGDGTARVVAPAVGEVPLLALSTGTNNAFGVMTEATVAGLAVGLVATGTCPAEDGCRRAKRFDVRIGEHRDLALVDAAVVDVDAVGARAVWDPSVVRELAVTIAEPGAVGLSSIAASLSPCHRHERAGRLLSLGPGGRSVLVPIAPGLVRTVQVREVRAVELGEDVVLRSSSGVVALDGEREIVLAERAPVLTLVDDGPMVIDMQSVLDLAARHGWLEQVATSARDR